MAIEKVSTSPPTTTLPIPTRTTSGIATRFGDLLQDLEKREKSMDRILSQAMHGRDFSPGELIAVQMGVYRYTQQLESFSKLVDRTTGAVRRTLEAGG